MPIPANFVGVYRVKLPKFHNYTYLIPNRAIALLMIKNTKKKLKKSQDPYMLPPRGVSSTHRILIKFGWSGNLPNVMSHARCQIN